MISADELFLAARIGWDWADGHHDLALLPTDADRVEQVRIPHTPEALREFLGELQNRFKGRPVGICIEKCRGGIVHALLEYDFIRLLPVNPLTLSRFREAWTPSRAKDDPTDADFLLDILCKHPERLRCWTPDDAQTRTLARLTQARRKAVDMRTRLTQRLCAELKGYFPQALAWTGKNLTTRLACDFLLKWPTLEALQRARPETTRRFYYGHNCRRGDVIEQRLQEIRTAAPLTTDPAIIHVSALTVQMLARQILDLAPAIDRYEEEIARLFESHPDAEIFASLPGAGSALAPRLLAAFGTDRNRFEDATEVCEYTGIAPVTERSGKKEWVHWRWSASTFLRQGLHEFAGLSIQYSPWARAHYDLQRERGKNHHAVVAPLSLSACSPLRGQHNPTTHIHWPQP